MRLALALLLTLSVHAELRLEVVRESLTGRHCRYREYVDGYPSDVYLTLECGGSPPLSLPNRRQAAALQSVIRYHAPLEPWRYDYDVRTRKLIRKVPLFYNSTQPARVFNPNPVVATNDPSLQDLSDAPTAVPEHAYETVMLDLNGPHATLVDRQLPDTELPNPEAPLLFDRGDDRFEPVNAYFHIDRTQRHLQSLGYTGARQLVPYAIEVDANAVSGSDASFFLPSSQIGRGTLFYGTGGTDDAEDGDLVVHEYGHAILEWIAPGTFAGTFGSEARAMVEGIPDYLAFSAHYDERVASGRDPFCFADWDARCWMDPSSEGCAYPPNSDCLRRLDSPRTMADFDRGDNRGVEHRNGQIWSSALREIFLELGRHTTDILVLEALFGVPPNPTFAVMARRMIEVDRLLFSGANAATICGAMNARGIAVSCDGTPRGELTAVQSPDRGIRIPDLNATGISSTIDVTDSRAIERLAVRVDIDHPTRGDLLVELHAPDGTKVVLKPVTPDVTRGIHATYGIDAVPFESLDRFRGMSAAGTWRLFVADLRARDAGVLQSWSLVFQFAGDEPQAARPRAAKTQMIPVVAHLFGPAFTSFASDVRVANVTESEVTATLIFTRSGADGTRDFSAVNVQLGPGHTASFDDIVATLFLTAGSGSLEVLGDVLVSSRLYTTTPIGGKLGQEVPANLPASDGPLFPHLSVTPPVELGRRYNLGMTEVAGLRTQVRFADGQIVTLEPYSHVQLSHVTGATLSLVEPAGRVMAYVSEIDTGTGDLTFFAGQHWPQFTRREIFPAIGATGADGTRWRTDVWAITASHTAPYFVEFRGTRRGFPPGAQRDVAEGVGAMIIEYAASYAGARIVHGATSQLVPPRELDDRRVQHLIGIDNDAAHRANVGIVTDGFAVAEVIVYDAAGTEVDSHLLFTHFGIAQTGIGANVTGGRAVVRHLAGDRIRAYASVIDRRSGDAAFVDGQ